MSKSKLLYYTDDSDSEVEVEIENVSSCEPVPVPVEPEPVENEVIEAIPKKPRGRRPKEQNQNKDWNEFVNDDIEIKMPIFTCPDCNKDFKRKHFLERHLRELRCSVNRKKLMEEKQLFEEKKLMEQKRILEKPKHVKPKPVKKAPVKPKPVKKVIEEEMEEEEEEIPKPVLQRQSNNIPIQNNRPQITFRFA